MTKGRPSKYKPEYCDQLIEHMASGLSFESFAGEVRVTKQTAYTWLEQHPDFLDAKKIGTGLCLSFWEKLGRSGAAGKITNFNAASWIFNMKNRFAWRDRQEIEHSGEIKTKQLSEQEVARQIAEFMNDMKDE